ncbi:MAG TPA: hypothetical protein DCS20_01935 [Candidatus Yonathbacteria bacterium]|nr:hypothetical protein [Candidatus Yonathbacteria bacterium]
MIIKNTFSAVVSVLIFSVALFATSATAMASGPALDSIDIATVPTKVIYTVGESLDITGLVVLGNYSDYSSAPEVVVLGDVTGFDSSTPAVGQILTVTIGGKTDTYTITVNAAPVVVPVLSSIQIATPASKLTYTVGESLDITGLTVVGTYSDTSTSTMVVVAGDITGFSSSAPAVGQILTVTIGGKTTTYTITVNAVPAPTPAPAPAPASGGSGGGGGGIITPPPARMQTIYPDGRIVYTDTLGGSGTPTTTPSLGEVLGASTFRFTRGLALGSRGEEVTELQNRLIALGLLNVEATGYFGKLTKAAVMKFQEMNGLEQVGNVGPKTRALLNSGVAVGTGSGATIPGCAVGNKFNTVTGQTCSVPAVVAGATIPGCAVGNKFNTVSGQACPVQ